VDKAMQDGAAVIDPKKRQVAYRQALNIMQERAYLYSGIAVPFLNMSRKEVQGLAHSFTQPIVNSAWLSV
jgi:hypothetical protein